MTHISRQFLEGDTEKRLVNALIATFSNKGTPSSRSKIAFELLTGVERLMLAKRLAIIVLIARGVPIDAIAAKLKVSSSTVSRLRARVEEERYEETIKAAKKNKVDDIVLRLLSTLLLGPRQKHAPRWEWLRDF